MNQTLPKIALGAWSWGTGSAGGDQVFGNHLSENELKPVFEKACELNLNLWDTAAVYGNGSSERILGNFIKNFPEENLIISTKFPPQIASDSKNAMQQMLDESKSRLNVKNVDIYWIHNPMDVERWTPDLIPLAKTGQIKKIGVSNHNLSEIKKAEEILSKEGLHVWAIQNHYSLLHRSSEKAGILDYCNEHKIKFFSYMVLEQGALTGRFDESNPFEKNTGRGNSYNPYLKEISVLVNELRRIGKNHDASPAQIATSWAISKNTIPIIGVTKISQVEEAFFAQKIILSEEEIKTLENLAEKIPVNTLREWEKEM